MDLLDYLKEFSSDFDDMYDELSNEIYNNLKNNISIDKSVDEAFSSTDFIDNMNNRLLDIIVSCYIIEYNVDNKEELKDILLNKAWIGNDNLKDRLDSLSIIIATQMKDTLKSNNLILESFTDYLGEGSSNIDLYNLKRKLQTYSQYDDSVLDIIDDLNTMKDNITKESVDNISSSINSIILLLLFGIMKSNIKSFIKNRYTMLSNTEGARANFEGLLRKTKGRNDVFGYRWLLSPAHYKYPFDVCDVNANSNVGFGKGIYPKNKMPFYPAHGHCICRIQAVYKKDLGSKINNRFDNRAVDKYVSTLSEKDRSKLFTMDNYEKYKKTKDSGLINNYGGYVNPIVRT